MTVKTKINKNLDKSPIETISTSKFSTDEISAKALEETDYENLIDMYGHVYFAAKSLEKQRQQIRTALLDRRRTAKQLKGKIFGVNINEVSAHYLDSEKIKQDMEASWVEEYTREVLKTEVRPFKLIG